MNVHIRPTIVLTIQKDRHSLATAIERLLNLLDDLDGDPDIEAGCDNEDVNEDGREDSIDGGKTEHGIADSDALRDFRTMWPMA